MSQDKTFKYDVFVSYGHKDKDWVKKSLLPKLKEINLTVCLDDADFKVGKSLRTQLEDAIKESEFTIIVLSPDYMKSDWGKFENSLINSFDPANRQKRVVPILLRECELPLRIRNLAFLDFTGEKKEHFFQFERFLRLFTKRKESLKISKQSHYFEYNLIKLNNLCRQSLSDRELIDLSYDHFSKVYENFSLEMSKETKLKLIIEYCERYQMVEELIEVIKRHRPELSDKMNEIIESHDLK